MEQDVTLIDKNFFFKQNGNVHIHISSECKDYVGVMHSHAFIEIVYVLSGEARHIIDDKEYFVKRGDISVINAYEKHAFIGKEDADEPFLAYDLMFTPDFLDGTGIEGEDFSRLSESFLFYSIFPEEDEKDFKERFNLITECQYEFFGIFEKLYDEYHRRENGYLNLMRLYTAEILIRLLRRVQQMDNNTLSATQKHLVARVIEYVEQNYSIKIKMEDIAAKTFFNKHYVSRLFKKATGLSVHDFVIDVRIKEACKQLSATDRTIASIAVDCGFADMKTFYAAFKKQMGCTPKAFRNQRMLQETITEPITETGDET